MEITYIGHSGYLVEWENCYWLFDFYKGEIPEMNPEKKLFVFASHKHEDHFNPAVFELAQKYKAIEYVLSFDIHMTKEKLARMGYEEEIFEKLTTVKSRSEYVLDDGRQNQIYLRTLKSTDCGVAFLLHYGEKTVYHAGDLNLWVWEGETKQYNNNMKAKFHKEMDSLKAVPIDIAFVPLDPRLGECYPLGLEALLQYTSVKYVFPMHFWDQPSIIQRFKKERAFQFNTTEIMDVSQNGQKWKLE